MIKMIQAKLDGHTLVAVASADEGSQKQHTMEISIEMDDKLILETGLECDLLEDVLSPQYPADERPSPETLNAILSGLAEASYVPREDEPICCALGYSFMDWTAMHAVDGLIYACIDLCLRAQHAIYPNAPAPFVVFGIPMRWREHHPYAINGPCWEESDPLWEKGATRPVIYPTASQDEGKAPCRYLLAIRFPEDGAALFQAGEAADAFDGRHTVSVRPSDVERPTSITVECVLQPGESLIISANGGVYGSYTASEI